MASAVHSDGRLASLCDLAGHHRALSVRAFYCGDHTNACEAQLVMMARSRSHAKALATEVVRHMGKPAGTEGVALGEWIALDYDDLIIHIMDADTHEIYRADGLWSELPSLMLT